MSSNSRMNAIKFCNKKGLEINDPILKSVIIQKLNNYNLPNTLITDIGSSKIETSKIIKKFLKKSLNWIQSHPIAGSEVSGPEHGKENIFVDKWCVLIKEQNNKKNHLNILSKFWKKLAQKL